MYYKGGYICTYVHGRVIRKNNTSRFERMRLENMEFKIILLVQGHPSNFLEAHDGYGTALLPR
jgi:hypothetical protein